jgi:battenin
MQLVAWADSLPERLFGVVLASISSGLGELSFLGMTHFYGPFAVPFWSSGTGGAGLVGAGLYVLATSWIRWSVRGSLMVFGFLPIVMLVAFFILLPLGPLCGGAGGDGGYERIRTVEETTVDGVEVADGGTGGGAEEVGLLAHHTARHAFPAVNVSYVAGEKSFSGKISAAWVGFRSNVNKTKRLFFP